MNINTNYQPEAIILKALNRTHIFYFEIGYYFLPDNHFETFKDKMMKIAKNLHKTHNTKYVYIAILSHYIDYMKEFKKMYY